MSSPWKTPERPQAQSFRDLMQEQKEDEVNLAEDRDVALALKLSMEENDSVEESSKGAFADDDDPSEDCTSDEILARMLQTKFDDEYVTTQAYPGRTINHPPPQSFPSDEDEDLHDEQGVNLMMYDRAFRIGRKGYATVNGITVTKHDPEMSGLRNMQKLTDNMPLSSTCGDAHTSKTPLSNRIYNELRRSAFKDEKRMKKHGEKKEHSTAERAMDESTRVTLQKAINNGMVESFGGIVATGKEAVVIHATGGQTNDERNNDPVPSELAVKVFKTTLNEFKNRQDYIANDYRFKDRFKKMNPRKVIRMWCEKELFNLKLLLKHAIPCPEPVTIKKHILFMRFIGDNGIPAPRLKDASVTKEKQKLEVFDQVMEIMGKMWTKAKLVHGDFSEFNLLYHQRRVWVIDVSQAVPREHPMALTLLLRDCEAVNRFFDKTWGLDGIPSKEAIFNRVTGYGFGKVSDEPHEPTDLTAFREEFEALDLEAQRRLDTHKNQFGIDFTIGREDDFDERDVALHERESYNDFLTHLTNMNQKIGNHSTINESSSSSSDSSSDERVNYTGDVSES